MDTYRFQVLIEQDEDGFFVADVPALQGCHTQGRTYEEVMENIREVIALCVQEMREDGLEIIAENRDNDTLLFSWNQAGSCGQ